MAPDTINFADMEWQAQSKSGFAKNFLLDKFTSIDCFQRCSISGEVSKDDKYVEYVEWDKQQPISIWEATWGEFLTNEMSLSVLAAKSRREKETKIKFANSIWS
jgi:hypothetical protein